MIFLEGSSQKLDPYTPKNGVLIYNFLDDNFLEKAI
jgi:hypothetical protein